MDMFICHFPVAARYILTKVSDRQLSLSLYQLICLLHSVSGKYHVKINVHHFITLPRNTFQYDKERIVKMSVIV